MRHALEIYERGVIQWEGMLTVMCADEAREAAAGRRVGPDHTARVANPPLQCHALLQGGEDEESRRLQVRLVDVMTIGFIVLRFNALRSLHIPFNADNRLSCWLRVNDAGAKVRYLVKTDEIID